MDPQLVVSRAAPMTEVVDRGSRRERFAMILIGTFAAVSLTLAAIGLYGVLSYMVRQRMSETGIRIALGASASQIRRLVLRHAAAVLGMGIIAGLAGALVLGRWLSSLLFQTSPWDLRIVVTMAVLLTITGLVSAWLPARRASRMDPRTVIQQA
jgi:ABC-type antimicrobial peptide transport system permease subunit